MNELLLQTLAEIVTSDHRAAAIFEKYQLDFCCKGKRSLGQACRESEIDVNTIIRELNNLSDTRNNGIIDYNEMTLTQLVSHITNTHHSYVKKEIPAIQGYLQKIVAKHGSRHPEMITVFETFNEIKEELECHMKKEELILFPRIIDMEKLAGKEKTIVFDRSYLSTPVTIMEHEHEEVGKLMEEIRYLTDNYNPPADACTTYRLSFASLQAFEIDLHRHVHLENNILFPKAMKLLVLTQPVL